jgi:hypothetical protein
MSFLVLVDIIPVQRRLAKLDPQNLSVDDEPKSDDPGILPKFPTASTEELLQCPRLTEIR